MRPDVLSFLDYRDYLKAVYDYRKESQPFFSYQLFGEKVGMDQSLFAKVLIKARNVAEDSIPRFINYLSLQDHEAEYFQTMVHFVKAKSDAEARNHFERMMSLRGPRADRVEGEQYAYFRRWQHAAMRSLLDAFDFDGESYAQLAACFIPPLTAKAAKESVQLLLKLGLIAKDANGHLKPTSKGITTGSAWKDLAVHSFQQETLQLALDGLERLTKQDRDYSTLTLNVDAAEFAEIRRRIKEFRNSIATLVQGSERGETVYQLNLQLLPVARARGAAQ